MYTDTVLGGAAVVVTVVGSEVITADSVDVSPSSVRERTLIITSCNVVSYTCIHVYIVLY